MATQLTVEGWAELLLPQIKLVRRPTNWRYKAVFKRVCKLLLFLALLWALAPPSTQAQVISCPNGFASSGSCGVSIIATPNQAFALVGAQAGSSPALVGSRVLLLSTGADHAALSFNYQTQVNVQAFTANFTFVPNGQNIALIFNNSGDNSNGAPGDNGSFFAGGAGCEADFFQGYAQPNPPNNVFALEFDSYDPDGSFTYSSAQIYTSNPYVQCPCLPISECGVNNNPVTIDKISTSPVPLNSPPGTANTTTGDTYSATLTYDGSNLTLNLYDVTAGGSCPGSGCFTNTWTDVDIAASVGGSNTAWVGFGGATNSLPGGSKAPLYVNSFVYNAGTPTSTPTPQPTATVTPTVTPDPTVTATYTPTPTVTPSPPTPAVRRHHKK